MNRTQINATLYHKFFHTFPQGFFVPRSQYLIDAQQSGDLLR